MAKDYTNIGLAVAKIKSHKAEALESFSKGVEILQELEEKTGYHHPLSDTIQGYISKLQEGEEEAGS